MISKTTNTGHTKKKILAIVISMMVWSISVTFYFHQYFLRISVSGLEPELIKSLHISALTISTIAATFFYAYVAMQIPCGLLIDRFGARISLTVASSACAFGCLVFMISNSPFMMEVGRIFMGAGASFAFVGSLTLARIWFSAKMFPLLNSLMVVFGTLGAILGGFPVADFAKTLGWHGILEWAFAFNVIITLMIWFVIRDFPLSNHPHRRHHSNVAIYIIQNLKEVLGNWQIWLLGVFVGLIYVPVGTFAALWCTPFLKAIYGSNTFAIHYAAPLIFVGLAFGAVLYAWLSTLLRTNVLIMRFGALFSLIVMSYIIYIPTSVDIMLALMFLLGLSMSSVVLGFVLVKENVAANKTATAISFVNMMQQFFGASLLPLIGYMLDVEFKGRIIYQLQGYPIKDYHVALSVLPASIVVGTIIGFFISDKHRDVDGGNNYLSKKKIAA